MHQSEAYITIALGYLKTKHIRCSRWLV